MPGVLSDLAGPVAAARLLGDAVPVRQPSSSRARRSSGGVVAAGSSLALAVCLVAGPSAGSASTDPGRAQPPPATRVLVFGDSISHASTGDRSWRWFADRAWRRNGTAVDLVGPRRDPWSAPDSPWPAQYADPGFDQDHAAQWGDSYVLPIGEDRDAVLSTHDPDVVVLELGANDVGWYQQSVADTIDRAEQWTVAARTVRPGLDLVLVEIPWTDNPVAVAYNAALRDLAAGLDDPDGARTVVARAADEYVMGRDQDETQSIDSGSVGNTFDPVHPNSRGQQRIAASVVDALAAIGVGSPHPRPLGPVPEGPPGAPRLTATGLPGGARLDWTRPVGVTSFDVWTRTRELVPDAGTATDWRRIARAVPAPASATGITDWGVPDLTDCTVQEFRVRGRKGWTLADWSSASPVVSTPIGAPVEKTAPLVDLSVEARTVRANWTPRGHACSYAVSWQAPDAAGTPTTHTVLSTATTASLPLARNGSVVQVQVRALDAWGRPGATGERWQQVRVAVGTTRLARVRPVRRGGSRTGGVTLTWQPSLHTAVEWQVRGRSGWGAVRAVPTHRTSTRVRVRPRDRRIRVRFVDGDARGPWSKAARLPRPRR